MTERLTREREKMGKGRLPYMQFYVDDWKSEFGLMLCSLAARGLWIEVLGAMHQAGRSGVLAGTTEQISRVCRCTASDVVTALSELRLNGVAEVEEHDGVYTIVSRRMRRESRERAQNAERQARFQAVRKQCVKGAITGGITAFKRRDNAVETETETDIKKTTPNGVVEKRFSPPTVEQIGEYCAERRNGVDPERFYDYYQSKGWMVGKVKMKDWRAAVRTWERNNLGPDDPKRSGGLMDIKIGG